MNANFLTEESQLLSNETLLAVAYDYLSATGFTSNQHMTLDYDAGRLHLHLLVTHIRFDEAVASQSNNYKKSEAIVRALEEHYDLVTLEQSKKVSKGRLISTNRRW